MDQALSLLRQLGVNETFGFMFVLFAVTYFTVSQLLTKPVGNLLVEREKRILGRQETVSKIRVELGDIQAQLLAERKKAQQAAGQKFSDLKTAAVTDQRKIINDAREEFSEKVKTSREEIDKIIAVERQKIERESITLKDEVIAKLLGANSVKSSALEQEA